MIIKFVPPMRKSSIPKELEGKTIKIYFNGRLVEEARVVRKKMGLFCEVKNRGEYLFPHQERKRFKKINAAARHLIENQ